MSSTKDKSYFGKANLAFNNEYANRIYNADNEFSSIVPPVVCFFLLLENGSDLLLENGSIVELECNALDYLLLENNTNLELENNSFITLE